MKRASLTLFLRLVSDTLEIIITFQVLTTPELMHMTKCWVNCLSEFGRLQRAGENIAVGSSYVIWSIARKTWCKAKVLKVFEDSVKVR